MSAPKKIAVILSGCGNKDGSEIQEAVSLIIALSSLNVKIDYFAPDQEFEAKNFLTGESIGKRNVLAESARITRSTIQELGQLNPSAYDGVALPGGFGAALNLSNWAAAGANCQVLPHLKKCLIDFHADSKPIAAICIAPALVAVVLGKKKITVTVGDDAEAIAEIQKTGAVHEVCPVDDYVSDREHKIITTPAYMYETTPDKIFKGITGLAKELVEIA